ncbi:general stress protein 26 [Paraliobacillus quinghaiensis]|uniref:General stress protein 26 n=1 Tax=Paraliobacillus quinghaiensis TaxID=470815 RepID=A0A917TR54_9BACI|nr:pyridoxamine 5'-phosphate oxidase family protein [Paraliobacillus quinghaiensis]GGM33606.1 general stress protein 26 [Paraliobacillus quinghaiensis]
MDQQLLKQTITKILDDHQIGTMATVEQDKPYSRYMTFFHDGITLYTATNKQTHKVEDIKQNPHVHILLGYTFDGTSDEYIEIEGEASIHDEAEMKQRLWNEKLSPWFSGPDDPNYTVLKITPTEIRLKNTQDAKTHKLEI